MYVCDLLLSLPPSPPPQVIDTPPARCDPKKFCHSDSQSREWEEAHKCNYQFSAAVLCFLPWGLCYRAQAGNGKSVRGEETIPDSWDMSLSLSDFPSTCLKWLCVCVCVHTHTYTDTPKAETEPCTWVSMMEAPPSPMLLLSDNFSNYIDLSMAISFLLLPIFPSSFLQLEHSSSLPLGLYL